MDTHYHTWLEGTVENVLGDIEFCCILVQTMRRAICHSVWGNTVSVDGNIHTLQHPVGVILLTMCWMIKHLVVL